MGTRQIALPGTTIKKSNALARAKWPVASAHEPALVSLVAARVNESDEDFHTYRIPISELIGKYSSKKDRQHLKSVIRGLMGRVIEIDDESGWTMYQVFSKCRYLEKEATLMVQFHPDLKSHYIGLKSRFTCYGLKEFLSIPGAYPKRLYEILKSWSDLPESTINVEDLREMVGVNGSLPRWQDFKTKVLIRGQKLIHSHTSLRFEWEPIKTGRKVTAIRFVFAKPRKKAVEKADKEKTGQQNNGLFLKAAKCWKEHGQNCTAPNAKTRKLCDFCKAHIQ
jgi:plasmid replication initiation protein